MTARSSDSVFHALTLCVLQIVFMIMIMYLWFWTVVVQEEAEKQTTAQSQH